MFTYDTNLTELGISGTALNDLNKQSVYTLGELLRLVDKKTDMKNNKLSAVKEFKTLTGFGLAASKEIIDLYGIPPKNWEPQSSTKTEVGSIYDTNLTKLGISDAALSDLDNQSIYTLGELLRLVDKKTDINKKADAVKELRAVTGISLIEAKEIIEYGLPPENWKQQSRTYIVAIDHETKLTVLKIPPENLRILQQPAIYTVGELLRAVDNVTPFDENKIIFIETIRKTIGLGLKDAKEIADLGIPPKNWQPSSGSTIILSDKIDYDTELETLQIPTDKLKILQKSINTVGELLEAVDEAVSLKKEVTIIKKLEEWTGLNSEKCTAIANLGLPSKSSANNGDGIELKKFIEDMVAEYYLSFSEILTELGKGLEQTQRELNSHSVEVQNIILKNKELADYGLNATWYTMPEIQLKLLMEYSINEKTTMEGTIKRTQKKIGIIPSNARFDILFESERKHESSLIVKFKQVPPPPMKIIRTEVPNLLGMTKEAAEESLQKTEINAVFEPEMKSNINISEMKVVRQNVNPGDFLLEGEILTVFMDN